jgi:hypothetical protein
MRPIVTTRTTNAGSFYSIPRLWLVLCVVLSTMPALKLGDVQGLELVQVFCLCLAAPLFAYRGMGVPVGGLWRQYGKGYLVFLCLATGVSILALRLPFFPPSNISVFKQPLILSLSRIFEFCLAICFMVAIAETLRRRPALLRLLLDGYSWVGTLSACASITSWVLLKTTGISTLLVYGPDVRVRGFFNEGGPYGMFLVSVVLVVLLRSHLFPPVYSFLSKAVLCVLLAALLLSGSKVGVLAGLGLCGTGIMVSGSGKRRFALIGLSVVLLAGFFVLFEDKLLGYAYAYMNFDESFYYRGEDRNLVMGRLTAAMIVPRMIAAHPLTGIGVGNYSLMRNDPDYLQGLPAVDDWDLTGMGLLGLTAEFGIPLTLLLFALLLRPIIRAGRRRSPAIVAVTAAFLPLAFLLGVNLNFFYPWLVAAFVLSLEPAPDGRAGTFED